MTFKRKTTLIAATVSAILSTTAGAQSIPANFDHNAALFQQQQSDVVQKSSAGTSQPIEAVNPTNSQTLARTDHFDRDLNTHTFSWAPALQKTSSLPFSVLKRDTAVAQATLSYVNQHGSKHGVSAKNLAEAELKYISNSSKGPIVSKYQQKVGGIEVYGRQFNVLMNQDMTLVATTGYFSNAKVPRQALAGQFRLSVTEAINKAFDSVVENTQDPANAKHKLSLSAAQSAAPTSAQTSTSEKAPQTSAYQSFDASATGYSFSEQPRGKKVYYPGKKKLIPAWYVEIMASPEGSKNLVAYSHIISARDGRVLNRTDLVQRDAFTYKAFADSTAPFMPFDSPMGNDLTPHPTGIFSDAVTETQATMNDVTLEHSGISTNDPWLAANATSTSGNNVDAYADLAAPDGFSPGDVRAQTTSSKTFDYSYDTTTAIDSDENINAAVVNLFYVNNYLHDLYYNHGFDEAAGVAQQNNFGRGGLAGDPIHAEAQDYFGVNNANMATPDDGISPRMQMFLWSDDTTRDGTVDNAIIEHEWGHYITSRLTNGGLYVNNQGGSMGEGWGDFFALMSMVREADQALPGNDLFQGVYNDGGYAVNNGYVTNAYFFGLRRAPYSTDMTHNALTFKHIEDGVALPTTHPYSNLASTNTQSGVFNSEVHNAGEIWALMLWESYAGLLNREALNFSEAQSRMMDYMVASLKITPFAPTYTEARDALLAVALANDVEDYNVIRTAFAKRGMGIGAKSPARFDTGLGGDGLSSGHSGVVESFAASGSAATVVSTEIDNQNNSINGAFCDIDGVLDVGETAMVKVTISNAGTDALSGLKARVSAAADVTFTNDGMIEFGTLSQWRDTTTGMVEVTLNQATMNQRTAFTVTFESDDPAMILPENQVTLVKLNRDLVQDRAIEDFSSPDTLWDDWRKTMTVENHGGDPGHFLAHWSAYNDSDFNEVIFGPNLAVKNDISLLSSPITVADSGDFSVEFDHYYDFEKGDINDPSDTSTWDGGVIEISIDGGQWTDVTAAGGNFAVGYNGNIDNGNPILPGRAGFVAEITPFRLHDESITFADGVLNGKSVQLRFRIGSDSSIAKWGWQIDNVSYNNSANATPFSSITPETGVCVNRPPIVTATGPQSVIETDAVTLTVSGLDHDNDNLSYSWTQITGTTAIDLSSNSGTSITFDAPVVSSNELYRFNVTASDGASLSQASEVAVMVLANAAPVLTTQASVSVTAGQSIDLTVNATDADGDTLAYTWTQDGTLIEADSNTFTFAAPAGAQNTAVVFTVTASDGRENSTPAQITVNINDGSTGGNNGGGDNNSGGGGGGGGGGSTGLFVLLLTPLAFIRRRRLR